jgi:hypothetical protein
MGAVNHIPRGFVVTRLQNLPRQPVLETIAKVFLHYANHAPHNDHTFDDGVALHLLGFHMSYGGGLCLSVCVTGQLFANRDIKEKKRASNHPTMCGSVEASLATYLFSGPGICKLGGSCVYNNDPLSLRTKSLIGFISGCSVETEADRSRQSLVGVYPPHL